MGRPELFSAQANGLLNRTVRCLLSSAVLVENFLLFKRHFRCFTVSKIDNVTWSCIGRLNLGLGGRLLRHIAHTAHSLFHAPFRGDANITRCIDIVRLVVAALRPRLLSLT